MSARVLPEALKRLAARYAAFAADEARGVSEIYERLASAVADSDELLAFIAVLPRDRQQPNLFFAAVRHLFGVPRDEGHLLELVRSNGAPIRQVMLRRATQTNEPARCAVLLPLLARLPQPLALLEVGASAGLCLLPDHYGYDYGTVRIAPPTPSAPVFDCRVGGAVPLPTSLPRVIWRRGLDLRPVDVSSPEDTDWLQLLVWPGQDARAKRLAAAIAVAQRQPPDVIAGDLLTDLDAAMATAPTDATLVVFHTAVLAYVASQAARDRFADQLMRTRAVWICNEVPGAYPTITAKAPRAVERGSFLMSLDGQPLAWTGPHGQSIDWFG